MEQRICKHCKQSFVVSDKPKGWMANHSRWCTSNPKRVEYVEALKSGDVDRVALMREAKRKTGRTNQYTAGTFKGYTEDTILKRRNSAKLRRHSESTKELIRQKALSSNHRRLKKGVVEYKGILLDSSWELALAKRLDEQDIKWVRPSPLKWIDGSGKTHNYFPDFLLVDYNVYLDPKNPYAIKTQKQKLDMLLQQHDNIVLIKTLEECKSFSVEKL